MLTHRQRALPSYPALFVAAALASSLSGADGLRRLHVGDLMPEFTLSDPNGSVFRYPQESARVLGVVVLQAKQNHLDRLVADLEVLAPTLKVQTPALDCLGVMSGPGAREFLGGRDPGAREAFPILPDSEFSFWGKLGVIAAPTAVVVGTDHRIQWVKAGYGYDFLAGFHAQLEKVLGGEKDPGAAVRVETLGNDSDRARRDRHIQLARTLAKKGRWESAAQELEKLRQADPNAVDIALELGEVLCRAGRNEAALETVSRVQAASNQDRARALWICAWARRQMADLAAAESLLTQALELDRQSPRILYELGKVHQTRGATDRALVCYRQALAQVFGDADVTGVSQK
ncbi:MAG: tetratricopeptide repeat protein [Planctomycetes bacterium]|nr:tetratricopeptide repeat protein [Planctomycetota bacterium]